MGSPEEKIAQLAPSWIWNIHRCLATDLAINFVVEQVDPATRRFVQANDAFAHMARRFGGWKSRKEITEAVYEDVKIAPPGAIERVLNFGTPFQLVEH